MPFFVLFCFLLAQHRGLKPEAAVPDGNLVTYTRVSYKDTTLFLLCILNLVVY